ncbi:MAG: tryptophan synthase subunit alpha, partial [Candidatus Methylomirabilales bacterium]
KGVTGARESVQSDLEASLARLRRVTDKPIAVGFGISTVAQVSHVAALADGVIVGSAIVDRIEQRGRGPELVEDVAAFVRALKQAMG